MAKPQDDNKIKGNSNISNMNDDVINAAFNPKSRTCITSNITSKISAAESSDSNTIPSSSLMNQEGGGRRGNNKNSSSEEEEAHPLLSLHQSVTTSSSDDRKMGNIIGGNTSDSGSNKQTFSNSDSDDKKRKVVSDNSRIVTNKKSVNSNDEKITTNHHNNNKSRTDNVKPIIINGMKQNEGDTNNERVPPTSTSSPKSKSKSRFNNIFTILIKTIIISILFILWMSLMHATFIVDKSSDNFSGGGSSNSGSGGNRGSIQESLPQVINHLHNLIHSVQFGIVSFGHWIHTHVMSPSMISLVDNKKNVNNGMKKEGEISIEQYQQRINIGKKLLYNYNDSIGCQSICISVLHSILDTTPTTTTANMNDNNNDDEEMSQLVKLVSNQVSYITSTFINNEIDILLSSLVCLGEVQLYMFHDTSSLTLSLLDSGGSSSSSLLTNDTYSIENKRRELLLLAKEIYGVATVINPINSIVRSGLGLSYLLLGVMIGNNNNNENENSPMQYIPQSIQHFKAAIQLTEEDNETDDNENGIVRNGALHNLGLAYIALDNIGINDKEGVTTTYYKDWMETLHSSSSSTTKEDEEEDGTTTTIMKNSNVVTRMNMGTMLLQLKRYDEAILNLQLVANNLMCHGNDDGLLSPEADMVVSRRQKEACDIVLQNLAVAKDALYGHIEEEDATAMHNVQFEEGGGGGGISRSIIQNVAMWNNANALGVGTVPSSSSSSSTTVDSSIESLIESSLDDDDDNMVSSIFDSVDATEDRIEGQSEPLMVEDEVNDDELKVESNEATSIIEEKDNEKLVVVNDLQPPASTTKAPKVNPQMQNALEALENAVSAGSEPGTPPPKTRMLLALAKARSLAGNISGAVDATLQAINVATTNEESEMSTLYLELIMDKLASSGVDDDDDEGVTKTKEKKKPPHHVLVSEEDEQSTASRSTTNNKDVTLLELKMKLELERLRYKVLEQDMKMQEMRRMGSSNHHGVAYDGDNMRVAIEYQQPELDNRDSMHHRESFGSRSDTVDVIEEESIIRSKETEKKLIEHEALIIDDVIQEDLTLNEETVSETIVLRNKAETEPTEDNEAETEPTELPDSETTANIKPMSEDAAEDEVIAVDETKGDSESADISQAVHQGDESAANATDIEDEEVPEVVVPIQLPDLFSPTLEPPSAIPPTAKSYMKMADAYLDKGQYPLASKQFLKVIKKAPNHLPAHLGYATALERAGKSKQMSTASLAYGNATKVAIIQGDEVDPMVKAGAGGLAENILRRAVTIAKSAPDKVETLQQLSKYAHTNALAADIYYEIGLEMVKQGIDEENKKDDAKQAFAIANEFVLMRNDSETPYHIKSVVEMGKIALDHENDAKRVIHMFNNVKDMHMDDDVHVELLVLVGRAYGSLGELETAVTEFTRALSFPQTLSTSSAHYELAIALKTNNGDDQEINQHFEQALDLGHDPTEEAIMALGERNMSVMRALNRQYYRSLNNSNAERSGGGGGIMSGGGVGSGESSSVFAPQAKQEEAQSDTLSLLEQGAASYDGNSPMGGEVEGTESSLEHLKAKKESKESNLANLRR